MSKQELVERQVAIAVKLEKQLSAKVAEYKAIQDKLDSEWKTVEGLMIDNNIKSIKGDWGTLTIAERLNWITDLATLPKKFTKVVPDTTKLSSEFRLYGKAPKGAEPAYTKYLTKRLKGQDNDR